MSRAGAASMVPSLEGFQLGTSAPLAARRAGHPPASGAPAMPAPRCVAQTHALDPRSCCPVHLVSIRWPMYL